MSILSDAEDALMQLGGLTAEKIFKVLHPGEVPSIQQLCDLDFLLRDNTRLAREFISERVNLLRG